MTDLLEETIAAHGGRKRWAELTTINTHLAATGAVWALKGQPALFASVAVTADAHAQRVSATPFVHDGWQGIFERDRVRIEDELGRVQEDRTNPRAAFAGHQLITPWDHLHAVYFGGYALWTYLTLPFLLSEPGFTTTELEPTFEHGESWRRLHVSFPTNIATHSTEQVLYIDRDGLIRRHDYVAEVVGGGPGAHYLHGHKEFDGIVFPTLRQVFPRQPDDSAAKEPLLINIEFESYTLT